MGPLHAAPMAIKDLIHVEEVRTPFGVNTFAEHVPDQSDTVVKRFEDVGVIVLGKTNTSRVRIKPVIHNLCSARRPIHRMSTRPQVDHRVGPRRH
ncbi:amidase family protein [Halomarina halobia]|uniref:Amidase family protein n=1 Tax=Halomarina halobia TaxID=3033386 RepID=A0ABD6AEG9_9EURY